MRRIPLKATTVPEAIKELRNLQVMRDKGQTVVRGRTPTLAEFAQQYIERLHMGNRKRPKTISSECGHLRFWTRELGRHRLHIISAGQIQRALDKRASDGRAPRTLNIALTSLRNLFAEAIANGLVETSPCQSVKWRKVDNKDRKLVTDRDFSAICDAAIETSKNGQPPSNPNPNTQ